MAGTSLLSQYHLLPGHPELNDKDILERAALQLVRDDKCEPLSRTSAVQICGRLRVFRSLPVIARLARSGPTIPLQLAAIAALGDMGGEREHAMLVDVASEHHPRLQHACIAALSRIEKRISGEGE
jgi:hypothetical protein